MTELVGRLREGTFQIGLHEDNNTELFDVSGADDLMFEAADHIERIEAHNAELLAANAVWFDEAAKAQAERDAAISQVEVMREALVYLAETSDDEHVVSKARAALAPKESRS